MDFQGNWVDLLIIAGILVFMVEGATAGLISGLLELAGFIISLTFAFLFFSKAQIIFTQYFSIPASLANAAGFFLVWIITESTYFFVARNFFSKIPQVFLNHFVNRFGGIIPAITNGFLFWAFLLTLFVALPVPGNLKSAIFDSEIGGILVAKTAQFEKPLASVFGPAVTDIQKSLTFLTVVPASRERVDLNFTQKELRVDPVSEEKMLALVNKERTERGLTALTPDSGILQVARAHAQDMFARGYFSHYSQEGEDAGDRLAKAGIGFIIAGENLAYAPDVIRAHDGLMDSSGHRKNILTAEFGKIGIGVIDGGIYGKMFTQVFTD